MFCQTQLRIKSKMKPVAEPLPAKTREERSHRICSVVRKIRPFSEEQEQKTVELLKYSREKHFKSVLFYARYGGRVADRFEAMGWSDELLKFEDEVFRLSTIDMEEAYRYYRDQFMAMYDKAFPGSSGIHVNEARSIQTQERDEESRSCSKING